VLIIRSMVTHNGLTIRTSLLLQGGLIGILITPVAAPAAIARVSRLDYASIIR
jgi:hypothetical protein